MVLDPLTPALLTWIDLCRIVTRLPVSGAGSCDWSMVTMKASNWSTLRKLRHSPARGLREEEGGCGADNGAQAEYEQRQHGGVASLRIQGVR